MARKRTLVYIDDGSWLTKFQNPLGSDALPEFDDTMTEDSKAIRIFRLAIFHVSAGVCIQRIVDRLHVLSCRCCGRREQNEISEKEVALAYLRLDGAKSRISQ